jgi:uncharacterized protein YjbI with pentapeptide repeats
MNEKIDQYLNGVFAPYEGVKSVAELRADLASDLQERFRELKAEGKDDETALAMTIDSVGDIEGTVQEIASLSRSLERQVRINLTAVDLQESDFAGVTLHKGKFKVSPLRAANFAGADLTGSSFEVLDAREANFDGANLTDCSFYITDLADASFRKSILVRTTLNMAGQGAKFRDVNLVDVKLSKTELNKTIFANCIFNGGVFDMADLRETVFENCVFTGVDFKAADLRGKRLDGLTFSGVRFDKCALNNASFTGATLRNVSFTLPFSVTNSSYRAMQTVCFDGARMDKLTHAALKGLRVIDLAKVTVI